MPRKGFTPEQIIKRLRTAEVELSQGKTGAQVCKKLGITEQTYYRCRKEYGICGAGAAALGAIYLGSVSRLTSIWSPGGFFCFKGPELQFLAGAKEKGGT
jgi:hypothetical protein